MWKIVLAGDRTIFHIIENKPGPRPQSGNRVAAAPVTMRNRPFRTIGDIPARERDINAHWVAVSFIRNEFSGGS